MPRWVPSAQNKMQPEISYIEYAVAQLVHFTHTIPLMKKALTLLFLSATTLLAQTNQAPVITAIDGYAARVDNTIITYGEIRESVLPFIHHLTQSIQGAELARQIQAAYLDGRPPPFRDRR